METRPQLTVDGLCEDGRAHRGTGGTSEEAHNQGFVPAFRDADTGRVYVSRYPCGTPAPVHLLAGLPSDVVTERDAAGNVRAVKASLVPGFLRQGRFHTREQAAAAVRATAGTGERFLLRGPSQPVRFATA